MGKVKSQAQIVEQSKQTAPVPRNCHLQQPPWQACHQITQPDSQGSKSSLSSPERMEGSCQGEARTKRSLTECSTRCLAGCWHSEKNNKRARWGTHACDPALCWLIKRDSKFEASLGYTMRPYLKEPKGWPGMWFSW